MKVLYISKVFDDNLGAKLHYRAVKEIADEENVFTIDLSAGKAYKKERYIAYGKYKTAAERIRRWLQGNMMFLSRHIISEICKIIETEGISVVYLEDSVFGNLVRRIKKQFPYIKVISFYHDIKAVLYPQWIKRTDLKDKIEFKIGIRQERINQRYCDYNIVFNKRDAKLFEDVYGTPPERIMPLPAEIPPLDDEYKKIKTDASSKKTLLFVGKKYYPNIIGLEWFYKKVLPFLTDNVELEIVGRGLEYLKEEFTDHRINVIGGVESLEPYYMNADIVIAPLFDGGGMKSKTVEALSFGKAFIGTEESLFGFWEEMSSGIRDNFVFKCDKEDEWIEIINKLASSEIFKFNDCIYDLFVKKFSYDAIKSMLKNLLIKGEK